MNSQKFISGLLLGTLAGLTLGLLFAPEKGIETRRMLGEKGNDLADAVKNKFGKYADDAEDLADEAEDKAKDWAHQRKAKDWLEEGKDKADDLTNNVSNTFS